jgi:hypothetical protein
MFSELCRVANSEKPVLLNSLFIDSTVQHSMRIVISYKGVPMDTIHTTLNPGSNEIPLRDITKVFSTRNWSSIELFSESPRAPSDEPYEHNIHFTLCHPNQSLEDIQEFAQRVHENRALTNDFIAYLVSGL